MGSPREARTQTARCQTAPDLEPNGDLTSPGSLSILVAIGGPMDKQPFPSEHAGPPEERLIGPPLTAADGGPAVLPSHARSGPPVPATDPAGAGRALCSVPDCGRPAYLRGWCQAHYNRWKKWGMVLAAIPIGDPRIYAVQKTCERCGEAYRAERQHQRWCTECRDDGKREASAASVRRGWWRNPALSRARQRAWVRANPERFKAAYDKCYRWPCPNCGKVRYVTNEPGRVAKEERLCSTCSGLARRKMVSLFCYWCESSYVRRAEGVTDRRHSCPRCFGALTKTGVMLGVTRERVRQLVNREHRRLNRDGHATRAEALAAVMEARRGRL